jgi:hypothetical protein
MRPNSACPDPAPGLKKLSNPPKGLFWGDPHVPRPECTIVDRGASSLARGMKSVERKHGCLFDVVFVVIAVFVRMVNSIVLSFLGCRIA